MLRIFIVFVVVGLLYGNLCAQEVDLEKIVVTPLRSSQQVKKTPNSISVITAEDIKNSNAQSVPDLLRNLPGFVVKDFYGNGVKVSVDSRGFGETSASNVLVLLDGRRLNQTDLSGVDWSQVPLDQVKRIEVIRGGSGSVLYGDNASSGVINIITKEGKGKPGVDMLFESGSYNMNKQAVSSSGQLKLLSYWIDALHSDTNGYRENSYFSAKDFASKFKYDALPWLSLRFNQGFHQASYGMPGALLESNFAQLTRRQTRFPRDHADDKDYYFKLGAGLDFSNFGALDCDVSFRNKYTNSFFPDANAGWNPVYKGRIDTLGITPKYIHKLDLFGVSNKFVTGADIYRYDYSMDNFSNADILQNVTDINKFSQGYYVQDDVTLFKRLTFVGGYRYESARYDFDYNDYAAFFPNPDVDSSMKPQESAYNAGISYNYIGDSNLFFDYSRSFRFPATDEFFSWGSLNTDLKPQRANNYEVGLRHRFNKDAGVSVSVFNMNLKNELYYNPLGGPFGLGANENYDKTRHQGIEFSSDLKILEKIYLYAGYTYTRAYFLGGIYADKAIPMVPRNKGTLALRFLLPKDLTMNVQANYVGSRYFINDEANNLSRLNDYLVFDMNLSYKYRDITAVFSLNNIFDKEYSEVGAYSPFAAQKGYYPSPGRSFNFKVKYSF